MDCSFFDIVKNNEVDLVNNTVPLENRFRARWQIGQFHVVTESPTHWPVTAM